MHSYLYFAEDWINPLDVVTYNSSMYYAAVFSTVFGCLSLFLFFSEEFRDRAIYISRIFSPATLVILSVVFFFESGFYWILGILLLLAAGRDALLGLRLRERFHFVGVLLSMMSDLVKTHSLIGATIGGVMLVQVYYPPPPCRLLPPFLRLPQALHIMA